MATRKIVKIGDDTLRKICRKQEKFDLRLAILLKDMADTMYKAEGVGLAAPQVGILRRVAVVDVTEDHSGLKELVNPEIIERSGSQTVREGCLSIPERQGVVTRPMKVKVRYQDRHGKGMELETEGFEAPQAALRARMSPLAPAAARRNRSGMTKGSNPPIIKTAPAKSRCCFYGGDGGIRTLDLTDANRTLSQLSYAPRRQIIITYFSDL